MAVLKTQRFRTPTRHRAARDTRWIGLVKALFILLLAGLFFLLAQSMLQHHFFSGSRFLHSDATSNTP